MMSKALGDEVAVILEFVPARKNLVIVVAVDVKAIITSAILLVSCRVLD